MAKLVRSNEDLDLGFQPPEPGTYIWEVLKLSPFTGPNSGKQMLKLDFQLDCNDDGSPAEVKGARGTHFVPIESEYGERQMNQILNIAGLIDDAISKFHGDIDYTDPRVTDWLSVNLEGKFLTAVHGLREYTKEGELRKSVDFKKFLFKKGATLKAVSTPSAAAVGDWS